ncbi:MAG: pilus assembly protein [Actinomycetia bacterium]|nr:pilus assembly protein [Actinomycetes bacterium]
MVELAIIMPLLIVLIFGIIEFGRGFNAQLAVTHAAREGVREYAITQDAGAATAVAIAAASTLDSGSIGIALTACNDGDPTKMTVTYPFQVSIPFFASSPIVLSGEGVMRCGG